MSFSDTHEYLHGLYDSLHGSPMQDKFRRLAPMPFGVVFLPWAGMTEEEAREHFRTMRKLGFTNLKQTMGTPEWPEERTLELALDEGVIPYWYGTGGWLDVTPELLRELGLPESIEIDEAIAHPKVVEYQNDRIRARIHYDRASRPDVGGGIVEDTGVDEWAQEDLALGADPLLRPDAVPSFMRWCRANYPTIEELVRSWNQYEVGISERPYTSWEDFESDVNLSRHDKERDYGFIRDVLRFKADYTLQRIRRRVQRSMERDSDEPMRAGGEMGLFLPFAWRGTDMEGIAEEMKDSGSFYPSIHLAWHLEEVGYEMPRTIYMMASICVDWFKGGWAATWESTGGPQQFSGGQGWEPKARDEIAAFTVDAGTMAQLQLSYLAGGFKGVGLWSWNARRAGWEGGEYALLNRQDEPTDRAVRAGAIAKAANRYRREIWEGHKEPFVGVFHNWDNEAIWAAISVKGRELFKHVPVRARVGISRALVNGNVPWEHVTMSDLTAGLASRYRTIYLPSQVALSNELFELLCEYAGQGGRVVLDAPGGWYDYRGHLLDTGEGTPFERLFGAVVTDYAYSSNVPRRLRVPGAIAGSGDREIDGFIMELRLTTATAVEHFDTGEVAVSRNAVGAGETIILAYEASASCWKSGNAAAEAEMRERSLGGERLPYSCADGLVYRLASPKA
ncbi:MAG TPA: beta-galactosidase trimerization domain-containing protein, partial [Spirochaetia bacterium]|nr:beta-galactosidase trimerization domain-containing protein [Spirochaetia bacterium]